ncbi:MAG: hypothetical protein KF872_05925 [Chitinophagales bacterium]|nr:hypothetical protein [Chitinophagales bacterium]
MKKALYLIVCVVCAMQASAQFYYNMKPYKYYYPDTIRFKGVRVENHLELSKLPVSGSDSVLTINNGIVGKKKLNANANADTAAIKIYSKMVTVDSAQIANWSDYTGYVLALDTAPYGFHYDVFSVYGVRIGGVTDTVGYMALVTGDTVSIGRGVICFSSPLNVDEPNFVFERLENGIDISYRKGPLYLSDGEAVWEVPSGTYFKVYIIYALVRDE